MAKDTIILFYPAPWPNEARGRIPYALLYLERMVRDLGVKVILIHEQATKDYKRLVEENKDRMLFVGVSSMTGYQIEGGIKFSQYTKGMSPDCPVVWGGWHPTLLPEQTLKEDYIDMVTIGQGELPFRALTQSLLGDGNLENIKGLAYKKEGKVIINQSNHFTDMNDFPDVDYSLLDLNEFVFKSAYSERCIGYFTSHGCPFHCAFCCVSEVFGRRWYSKKIETIIRELQYFKKAANVDSITFDDDNFFVNKNFTLQLCQAMIDAKLDLLWDTSAHAALFNKMFTDADIDLCYRAGCRQIYVGAESGDQDMLNLIDKKSTVDDNIKFVQTLNAHHITPLFSTMVCFPVDPDKDLKATKEMIMKAKLIDHGLRTRVFFYTPYPGTKLYEMSLEKGLVPPDNLKGWAEHTLRKFHAPWWTHDYRWELEVFANFYIPLANPYFYKFAPKNIRPVAYIVNKLFYPIVILRLKYKFLKYPIEAVLFIKALKLFNRLAKTNFSLGYESYLE